MENDNLGQYPKEDNSQKDETLDKWPFNCREEESGLEKITEEDVENCKLVAEKGNELVEDLQRKEESTPIPTGFFNVVGDYVSRTAKVVYYNALTIHNLKNFNKLDDKAEAAFNRKIPMNMGDALHCTLATLTGIAAPLVGYAFASNALVYSLGGPERNLGLFAGFLIPITTNIVSLFYKNKTTETKECQSNGEELDTPLIQPGQSGAPILVKDAKTGEYEHVGLPGTGKAKVYSEMKLKNLKNNSYITNPIIKPNFVRG